MQQWDRHLGTGKTEKILELGQTQQHVSDSFFYLYRRTLHPELFCIHKSEQIRRARYQAEIWVMGLAHIVSFQAGSGFLTELVCDESDLLPANGLATSFRLRGERDHNEAMTDGIKYMMSSQVERMSQNLFEVTHRDFVAQAKRRGVFVSFADWANDGLAPFTTIEYEARDKELHVYTYHAFPDELTLLKTQSIFEVSTGQSPRRPA